MIAQKYPVKTTFKKEGAMIHYSQADMATVLERALRRSKLPVYFTQGFNPRIKISFYGGLKLGIEGNLEVTFYFSEPTTFEQLHKQLSPQLPEGLRVVVS